MSESPEPKWQAAAILGLLFTIIVTFIGFVAWLVWAH